MRERERDHGVCGVGKNWIAWRLGWDARVEGKLYENDVEIKMEWGRETGWLLLIKGVFGEMNGKR